MKILILEDDPDRCRKFLRSLFKHSITFVEHSYDAVEILKKEKYDLICLDHDLNGKQMEWDEDDNGLLVAEFIADQKILTPVVIHSFNCSRSMLMLEKLENGSYLPGIWNAPLRLQHFFPELF